MKLHLSAALILTVGLCLFVLESVAAPLSESSGPPDFDRRAGGAAAGAASERKASVVKLRTQVAGARIDFNEVVGGPKWVRSGDGYLTGPGGEGRGVSAAVAVGFPTNDPHRAAKAFVQEHQALFGFGPEALSAARVCREYTTPYNGVKTTLWQQELDGIEVYEAVFAAHTTKNGELIGISSQFMADPSAAADAGATVSAKRSQPIITAQQAAVNAAGSLKETVDLTGVKPAESGPAGRDQRQQFTAGPFNQAIKTRLVWLPMNPSQMRLCWEVTLTSRARGETFRLLVDAQTGEVRVRRCLTVYLSDATYRVYTSDSPSPFSPGWSTPNSGQPPLTNRVLVTWSALDTNASPNGWIDDGVNETRGNNVDAHTDRDANNVPDLPRPQGSPFRVFDCPMDLAQSPATYTNAAVVQLFYWCNFMHDKLYELGFTEAAGNFQNDNFGRGGLENDALQADAQDGSGYNNANFTPTPDGTPPRIQMYLFNGPAPYRDGDFDAEVVLHEYTHGLSCRLVGGGVGISALQTSGMGEGWSDWYAMAVLSEPEDDVNGVYACGAYVTYMMSGMTQNYYFGIRRYPYCTDMTKNPLTFKDIDPAQASAHTGIPRSPIIGTTANEVHNMGEVWCMTLREARASLINKYGWAVGNPLIMQLVTDGMKLGPANPNFLQARDAILLADQVDTGGANRNELWAAFAKRGLGFTATSPSSSTTTGLHEAFDIPDDLQITPYAGFSGSGPVGGPFTPNSAAFTLTNSGSSTLNWTMVNTSAWLNVSPSGGTLTPGGPAASVTASLDTSTGSLPMGIYSATVWFTNLNSLVGQNRQFTLQVGQPDYFTELFDTTVNDLAFQRFTFTPDGGGSFYAACRETATSFPTDPTGGTTVTMSDDTYAQVTLSGTNTVAIYGTRNNVFYIGSNGYLTMNSGDTTYTESLAAHFNLPRVSALFDDLLPTTGQVTWKQMSNRVAVTYLNVPEYGATTSNSFQIEMFYDGRIRLTYLGIAALDGLAGLSAGTGVPAGFTESDFTSYGSCSLPLFVDVPPSATEGDGVLVGAGQVRLLAALAADLVVTLSSSDATEVTVPANVTILAGQTNAAFDLTIVDDGVLDGTQTAAITASAPGYNAASTNIAVFDNETATLGVVLPATATEGQGTVTGTVQISAIPAANIIVGLSSSDTTEIQVPASVVVPSGQTSVVFTATVVDDNQIDGPQTATVTAHVQNWTDGSAIITVLDNENTNLTVTLPASAWENAGVVTNAGSVHISGTLTADLVVSLVSSNTGKLIVPPTVTIAAGQVVGLFNLTVVDNSIVDGNQTVFITASASGFNNGSTSMLILDDEIPPMPSNPSPAHLATNVVQTTGLSWQSGAPPGDIITNDVYFGTNPAPGAGECLGSTTNTSWILPALAPQTTYYWQIVARKTGTTAGPVWQFTTRGVDHFAWDPISSPQFVNQPFSATIAAKDAFNVTVSNFNSSISLAGYSGSGSQTTNRMLDGVVPDQSSVGTFTWGYLFTPTNNLVVTHVRSYFGTKVSLWTSAGVLLASQNVAGSAGTWTETALGTPVTLAAGSNYVVAAYVPGTTYYWIVTSVIGFPNGTISQSLYSNSDTFPTSVVTGAWPMVGLRYTVGSAAPISITPTNSGNFVNGVWSGNVTVLQPATNMFLLADDGSGHTGSCNPFDVVILQDLLLISPSDGLVSQGYEGGSFDPSNKVYTLSNMGTNALNWSVSCRQAWVPVLTNSSADAVRVMVINSTQSCRFFRVVVSTPGVQPMLSAPTFAAGQFRFTLSGQTNATYIIEALTDLSAQAGWVAVDPSGGSLAPGASTNVNVLINTNACSLSNGVYTATAVFRNLMSGAAQERPVTLTVLTPAPAIITQPASQLAPVGGSATFSVTATGKAPLGYYWQRNGAPIAGANSSSYTTNNVQLSDSGSQFSCLVSNAFGTAFSSNATLFVAVPSGPVFLNGSYLYLPIYTNGVFIAASTGGKFNSAGTGGASGVDFWWPGTPVYNYVVGVGGTSYANGNFQSVTTVNLSSDGVQRALIDATVITNLHFTRDISFAANSKVIKIVDTLQNNGSTTLSGLVTLDSTDPDQDYTAVPSTYNTLNDVVSVNLTNDLVVASGPSTGLSLGFGSDSGAQVPSAVGFNNTNAYSYLTVVDPNGASGDIAINLAQSYGSLSPGQSKSVIWYMVFDISKAAVTNAFAALWVTTNPPAITSQPTNQTVVVGGTANFSVTASGTPPLSCQWNFNGTNISWATNGTLTLTNVQLNQAGNYQVLVTNLYGSILSSNAVLTVVTPSTPDSFNPGANGVVYSTAVQTDGKVLVGGYFTTLGGQSCSCIGRLNAAGTLDTSFNPGANGVVYSLVVQADGKILVGGTFTTLGGQSRTNIGRLNIDGTLDTNFNPGANSSVYSLVVQADGKIVAGGYFTTLGGQSRLYIGRLNADGTLDTSFNPGASGYVYSLAMQADGKILVGGIFTTLGSQSRSYIGRLNADGTLDTSFNPGANNQVESLAVQADGKILVSGQFTTLVGQSRSYIGRLNANGTLDTGFNPGASSSVASLVVQADGKILAGGYFTTLGGQSRLYIGRLNADGTLDTGFNPGASDWVLSLSVQADGKILVGGTFTILSGQSRLRLGRLTPTEPATKSLAFDGFTIIWQQGGSSPEVWRTTFDGSTNGSSWIPLGVGTRVAGGWQLSGLAWPTNASLRARGFVVGGFQNGSGWFVETITGSLVISLQPTNQTVVLGGTANFNVTANGPPPLGYQWNFNGTNLSGATNAMLTLTNVQTSQAGNYQVLVTNLFGSLLSSNAVLTVVTLDHFAWNPITSPRFANAPFAVTIQARDLTNGLFTNFTGTAFLETTNGVAVAPAVSGNFVQGVWTGLVVISQTASNLVLRANDGLGHIGLANPINVIHLPSLGMLHSGNIALYMWPVGYSGFVLETSGSLSPATWVTVPYVPIQIGDQYLLPIAMAGTNGFYRLRFSSP